MSWLENISNAWRALRGSPSPASAKGGGAQLVPLDDTPTPEEEAEAFSHPGAYDPANQYDPEHRKKTLANVSYANDIRERRRFAGHAYRLNAVWLAFLFALTWLQGTPDPWHFELPEFAFAAIFGATTLAVF